MHCIISKENVKDMEEKMALLDGFNVIPLKDKIGEVYLTITAKSLKFNRANARALDLPENIKILLNEKNNQLAIIPARTDDENGIPFSFEEGGREHPILVKEAAILKVLGNLVTLERDGRNLSLKIKGAVFPKDKTIIYDLDDAVESIVKPRGRAKKVEA